MNTDISLLPIDELRSKYLLANTATFIVREFRAVAAVQQYADSHAADAIAHDAMIVAKEWEINADTLTIFYAMLVALSFKTYLEGSSQLKQFRFIRYDFMPELIDIIMDVMSPTTILLANRYSHLAQSKPISDTAADSIMTFNINTK